MADLNPDLSLFINLIDYRASQIYKTMYFKRFHGNHQDMQRLACYSTALGHVHYANITQEPLLISIDPVNYFRKILPSIDLHLELSRQKPRFKLAYLIMVHESKGFPHLVQLLEFLDDGDAIILVHVDARSRSSSLYQKIVQWIRKRKATKRMGGNVHLARFRFHNIWVLLI
jgi:hypothetical protein